MLCKPVIEQVRAQFQQEAAEIGRLQKVYFHCAATCGRLIELAQLSSQRCVANSRYRYPSPNRPAYSPSRPMTVFRRHSAQFGYDIGYHGDLGVSGRIDCINCDANSETTIGLRLCKRHQSSLRQWRYSVWQVAFKTMRSAQLQAQVLALWLQNCLEQTAQAQWFSVQPLAYSAMTRAYKSANKLDKRAYNGRLLTKNRHRGFASVAVLRFGD
ncbi:MAG: hypothetical protein ACJASZ_001868 [Yoonia sp.]|jgi:hypothetical protein